MEKAFYSEDRTQNDANELFRIRKPSQNTQEYVSVLEELKKTRKLIRNANDIHREHLTRLDKFAVWITRYVGTMGFFAFVFVWTAAWLIWNTLAPSTVRFDPYPAFVFWLFLSQVLQLLLMPLIMIGQNLDAKHAKARAQANYDVNIKAEKEVEIILTYQEKQNHLMLELMRRHEAYHQELLTRISHLDPDMARRLGFELREIGKEMSE